MNLVETNEREWTRVQASEIGRLAKIQRSIINNLLQKKD